MTSKQPPARKLPPPPGIEEHDLDEVVLIARGIASAVAPPEGLTDFQAALLEAVASSLTGYEVDYLVFQIQRDLPPGFYTRLPSLAGPSEEGLPRVYAVAHGLLAASRMQFSLAAAVQYVNAYQEGAPLTIAELWAFPTMVRLACLEILCVAFERLVPGLRAPFPLALTKTALDSLEHSECVARAIANLSVLSSTPWNSEVRNGFTRSAGTTVRSEVTSQTRPCISKARL